ncbi:redoxin family protein [Micromonospora fulviviridis]|uniref:redoxin family protein n=1 Tax=Micromonospora fulviviridis TaxID=47860 RepID=UPI0037919B96
MARQIPPIDVQRWVNSPPLTPDALHGRVVLVDIWEYTCINWIRTAPYVKAWHRDYTDLGLTVVGVHAPEFEFGRHAENIDRAIRDHGLTYPIALDNNFTFWRALGNDAWPAKYLFDADGRFVDRWVGEGDYERVESEIRRLLGDQGAGHAAAAGQPRGVGVRHDGGAQLRRHHAGDLPRRRPGGAGLVQRGR